MIQKKTLTLIAAWVALLSAGCGSSAVPVAKLSEAKSTARAAQEAGAQSSPEAALHLKMANDALASAQQSVADGDGDRAQLLLNQAQADADLSLSLARGATQKRQAQEAEAKVDNLMKQGPQ